MNPFEKRDKILRTPPGVSFHERSFFNPDRSAQADCSLYDDSGARVLEMPEDLKRYTLTFEDGKTHGPIPSDFRVSFIETDRSTRLIFPLRTSLIENSQLYTSSPLGKTTFPTRTESPTKSPPNVSSELVTKVNVHSASAENTLSSAKQINSPETDSMVPKIVDSSLHSPYDSFDRDNDLKLQTKHCRQHVEQNGNMWILTPQRILICHQATFHFQPHPLHQKSISSVSLKQDRNGLLRAGYRELLHPPYDGHRKRIYHLGTLFPKFVCKHRKLWLPNQEPEVENVKIPPSSLRPVSIHLLRYGGVNRLGYCRYIHSLLYRRVWIHR
ncbi:hypothetical protein FGIG_01763 [Fasciola gigantica]|uniref:Uncharacterized protein n=1 Tax=Fasciola gigantica TaxID=46835 RepID=A0A504YFT8_FASGI|nr:hypothetical protein FGIG_01763 [Fasciola gigantica]